MNGGPFAGTFSILDLSCCALGEHLFLRNITSTGPLNVSVTNVSGDVVLADRPANAGPAFYLPGGGNIVVTAMNGRILDFNPNVQSGQTMDSPATLTPATTTSAITQCYRRGADASLAENGLPSYNR